MLNSVRPDIRGGRLAFLNDGDPGSAEHTFPGSSEAGLCRKHDFCVQQTDLFMFAVLVLSLKAVLPVETAETVHFRFFDCICFQV